MIHDLCSEEVRQISVQVLQENISLETEGYKIDTAMTWNVLLKAAVERSSIEASCSDLVEVADSNTIREHLNASLDVRDLQQLEVEQNAALAATIPREVKAKGVEVAMDWHDEAFYGKSPELLTYVCRCAAKAGTTRCFRIATAYVMLGDFRLTVAMTYVLPEYSHLAVLKRLWQRVSQVGIRIKVLYLDKGFCQGDIIRYLQDQQQPTIMACPIRGKGGGTRALCQGRRSYRTIYTFTDGTTTDVAVVATFVRDHQTKRKKRHWHLYVVIELTWPPKKIGKRYRRRFGIECSYRQMRQVRPFSNARNPALRFFLLGLALIILNIWRWLRWCFTRRLTGRWRVDPHRFRLHRFVQFLRRAIEQAYGVILAIPTHLPPKSVIH